MRTRLPACYTETIYIWNVGKRTLLNGCYNIEKIGTVEIKSSREREAIRAAREKYGETGLRVRLSKCIKRTYTLPPERILEILKTEGNVQEEVEDLEW